MYLVLLSEFHFTRAVIGIPRSMPLPKVLWNRWLLNLFIYNLFIHAFAPVDRICW